MDVAMVDFSIVIKLYLHQRVMNMTSAIFAYVSIFFCVIEGLPNMLIVKMNANVAIKICFQKN